MNNSVLRVSVKFGLILAGINLVFALINNFTFNPENLSQRISALSVLTGILTWCLLITCLVWAHYEFSNDNEDYLSFKDALLIGLLIIGISFIISELYSIISNEFIMKEKMNLYYSNLSEELGIAINEIQYSTFQNFSTTVLLLLFQILVLFILITVESLWKIYKKAGKAGWASIVPIYNTIVLLEIIGKPIWWLALLFIPIVNIVIAIWMTNMLSKRFGKDDDFTIGLIFLPIIFYPLLGLSKAEYKNFTQ